jgi:5-formyltetrahydrofolate cyclo-ligase
LSSDEELREEKKAMRARMVALREAISAPDRERMSEAAAERLFSVPALSSAMNVLAFAAFGSEIATAGVIRRLHAEGRRVLLPRLRDGDMSATDFLPGEELAPGAFGIGEPFGVDGAGPEEIDAVIAPGLAFDRDGYRLGYGRGYFDRYLRRLRPNALRVGLGFQAQLIERVPRGPGDEPLDAVVTDLETVYRETPLEESDGPA